MKLRVWSLALALMAAGLGSGAIAASPANTAGSAREHAAPPPEAEHTTFYIVVNKFGRKIRGSHGTSALTEDPGEYIARFPVDVSNCVYVATLGRATTDGGVYETAGFISVVGAAEFSDGVYVQTRGLGNHVRNRPFHLLVAC